jgi:hypothetical protein
MSWLRMAGEAMRYVLPRTIGEGAIEFMLPVGFTALTTAMAPGDAGDKAKVFAEQLGLNFIPSLVGRGIGAGGALAMGAKKRLTMAPEEFDAHILGKAQFGGVAADMSNILLPQPALMGAYQKEAERQQVAALQQQQAQAAPVAAVSSGDPRLDALNADNRRLSAELGEEDDPYRQHLMSLVMQGAYA